jgi:aminopeptidase-like protein
MYNLAKKLWPIHRSITGIGVNKTLKILKNVNNNLQIKNIKSGTKVFDWKVPKVWHVKEAWIKNTKEEKLIDIKNNNLHLMGYSVPVDRSFSKKQIFKHLHYLKNYKEAIPYLNSYYKKNWGFCIKQKQLKLFKDKKYHVKIDSNFKDGYMKYGEIFIKGKSKKEIFFSTYICHPSMANNELSGPCLLIYLSNYIKNLKNRKLSYRFIFIPETIGSISYLHKNLAHMKKKLLAGYNVSCVGDERDFSFLPSIEGNTYSDFLAKITLKQLKIKFKSFNWLERGSDERQYCSPGIALPISSIMRTKYGNYKEYHTSEDKIGKVLTKKGLKGSFQLYKKIIKNLESDKMFKNIFLCEPMMGKRNMYKNIDNKKVDIRTENIMNVLAFTNGKRSVMQIAELCKLTFKEVLIISKMLTKKKVIKNLY